MFIEEDDLSEVQLVVFGLGREEFGVDIAQVREIIKMVEITKMPSSPDFIEGVINLRGQITAVMDLRKRLDITPGGREENARIVIVKLDGNTMGMIVDSVSEVLRLRSSDLDEAPTLTSPVETAYIRGVGKLDDKILILLDLNMVLNAREVAQIEQAGETAEA